MIPNNQVVLITGSSTGFGRKTAEQLAGKGYTVYATMRHMNSSNAKAARELEEFASTGNYRLRVMELDVTNEISVRTAIGRVVSESGRLDVLVNNAGIWGPGVLEAYTLDQWKHIFDTNVFGSIRTMREALPVMRTQGSGLIIQISSLQGRFILPYSGPYVASKFAVEGAAETFKYEVAPFGVEVSIVEPYDFMTEMKEKAKNYVAADQARQDEYPHASEFINAAYLTPDPSRAGNPQEVVDAIIRLIETPAGKRPLRTTVKSPLPQIDQINEITNQMHRQLYPNIGLGNLLQVPINQAAASG